QHVVDRLGKEEAGYEGDGEGDQRLDQPRAQLDQVLHQRRLGRLDLLLLVVAAHAALPPASPLSATVSTEAGSAELGAAGGASALGSAGGVAALGDAGGAAPPPAARGSRRGRRGRARRP